MRSPAHPPLAHTRPELSLIVPAYRCLTIDTDLRTIYRVLKSLEIPFELICVVDGRAHQHDPTEHLARSVELPHLVVLSYPINQGKGHAVRYGFAHARGKYIGFIDAGNDINPRSIEVAFNAIKESRADMAIGNKRDHLSTVSAPPARKLYSVMLRLLIRIFFDLRLTDTQVGLKIFRAGVVKRLLPHLRIRRWAFDVELLALARQLHIDHIIEIPVKLTYNASSNITTQALIHFFYEFFVIFWRMKIRRHYPHA